MDNNAIFACVLNVKKRKDYIPNSKVLYTLCRLTEYKSKSKIGTNRRLKLWEWQHHKPDFSA